MSRTMILAVLLAPACFMGVSHIGSGDAVTEGMALDGFDGVHNDTPIDVTIHIGERSGIQLTCDDNLFDEIVVEVVDGELSIRTRPDERIVPRTDCVATVEVPSLRSVSLAGTGRVRVADDAAELAVLESHGTGRLSVEGHAGALASVDLSGTGGIEVASAQAEDCALSVHNSGTGGVRIDAFEGCELEIDNSGTGSTSVAGRAAKLSMRISGTGGAHQEELVVDEADVRVSGTGGAEVTVLSRLRADLSGTGGLRVHGDPPERQVEETGTGRVRFE